jgi:hypothetical protein
LTVPPNLVKALKTRLAASRTSGEPYRSETKGFVEVWLYENGTMVRRPAVYSRPVLRGGESE